MDSNPNLEPSNQFSPSELVLLNGEHFAKKIMMGNFQLMHIDASVSYSQLGEAILTTAALALKSIGNLQFDIREDKAMFGLRKVKSLYIKPAITENNWPDFSPESQFIQIAEKLNEEAESAKLSDLIYIWLRQDSPSPWQSTIEMVQSGLAARNLLEKTESTKMKVFTTTNYGLPESTAKLARQYSIEPISSMINDYEKNQKEIWELLKKEQKSAIKQRTEQDDMDFD